MFIRIDDMIINLDHVIDIHFTDEIITFYTTDTEAIGLEVKHTDELLKALAKYNEIKGYRND